MDENKKKSSVWLYAVILFFSAFIVLVFAGYSQIKLNKSLESITTSTNYMLQKDLNAQYKAKVQQAATKPVEQPQTTVNTNTPIEPQTQPQQAPKTAQATSGNGLKERQFIANTIQNSPDIPQELKTYYEENPVMYQPVTNADQFNKATEKVDTDFQKAYSEFSSLKNLRNGDDTALGEALVLKAIQNG
jgi:predicted lipid-binding transport protein (Tim44 family)